MERVQDAEQTVEVFENEIQMYLSMFCESNAIESEYDILPSQWNAALSYIYKHVIKPNPDILTIPHTVSNSYNINAVDDLLEMYIYMCYCHNQEISIKGFCLLSGISRDTIHSWGNSNTRAYIYKDLQGNIISDIAVNNLKEAFSVVLDQVLAGMNKRKSKAKYFESPILEMAEKNNEPLSEKELQLQRELFVAKLEALKTNFEINHNKQ